MGMIIWNIILTVLVFHLMLCIGKLAEEIEAMKSWFPLWKEFREKNKGE